MDNFIIIGENNNKLDYKINLLAKEIKIKELGKIIIIIYFSRETLLYIISLVVRILYINNIIKPYLLLLFNIIVF